jgi:hypothetical protein
MALKNKEKIFAVKNKNQECHLMKKNKNKNL